MGKVVTFDIESNNLLNEETIDYLSSPYKLKDEFKLHCIVVEEHDTGKLIAFYDGDKIELDGRAYKTTQEGLKYFLEDYIPIKYEHRTKTEFKQYVKENVDKVIAHNGINFDHLVCKLYFEMDYTISPDTWDGKDVVIEDTLVTSKTLNPDRYGGHSLDSLGKKVGLEKLEFRKHIPKDEKFKFFFADMLYYCIRDVQVNTKVYHWLQKEKEGWDCEDALELEKNIAEIITRQEHRGFKFDKVLAESNIKELDILMEERRVKVEPELPPRKPTKKFLSDHTPPVQQIKVTETTPPKNQFKKDGSVSKIMEKFVEKNGEWVNPTTCRIQGKEYSLPVPLDVIVKVEREPSRFFLPWLESVGGVLSEDMLSVTLKGVEQPLPLPVEAIETEMVATISDTTHIKDWLVGLGWIPNEWKMKDITVNQKKDKLTEEAFEKAVKRYVDQTLASNFCKLRCAFLKTTPKRLEQFLLSKPLDRTLKVMTNPSFTVGQDKEMCRDLDRISEVFPYAKDIVEYLTYRHRRNSILGGGVEYEDYEEEANKGYLAYVREDGRIPTPADTCGAATSRFKHKLCANIPRVTSLYGEKMRALFGVDEGFYQMGYDFDSLEAKEEASYCWKYEGEDKEYCNSLTLPKPNDVHSVLARKITEVIGRKFERSPAKSCKYGITYGSSAAKVAQIIGSDLTTGKEVFDAFWVAASPLKQLKDALSNYWETSGGKKFILGIDGRKVPTRSAHAILNSLFQSAGVICAKRAMLIHDRLLKENDLGVDFFKDDWRNKDFAQQLIGYHDEAQLEVRKQQVRFKMFNTEEEAEQYKKESKFELSDISHSPDGRYFLAYCKAGVLAAQAVRESGEYYKLNVPLTAGYIIGTTWASCH